MNLRVGPRRQLWRLGRRRLDDNALEDFLKMSGVVDPGPSQTFVFLDMRQDEAKTSAMGHRHGRLAESNCNKTHSTTFPEVTTTVAADFLRGRATLKSKGGWIIAPCRLDFGSGRNL